MDTEIIVWLALVVVFVLVELATTALVSIWLVAGAVAALIVSLFTDSWPLEFAVFAVVSAVALIASRPLARRLQSGKAPDLNTGLNIGRTVTVVAASEPGRPARVRLDGVDWSAECASALTLGEVCRVTGLHGTTLTVEPIRESAPAAR